MPVFDFVLAELPAQLDELAVAKRREVDQPLERTLELDAHAVEAQHSLEQLLFGTLDSVLRLLLPLAVAAIPADPLHRVLGHPQLLLEVGATPKRATDLQRLRNMAARPAVAVLFAQYEDEWSRLWWVRIDGAAPVVDDGLAAAGAIDLLAGRYEQYLQARPGGPVGAI